MDFDYVYLRVLKFLNFRPRSEKEVRDYLKKILRRAQDKKYISIDESIVDVIVHRLKQQKFLNDEEFAKWLVRSRTDFKPKGERIIRQELFLKGISKDIIEQVLESTEHRAKGDKELAIEVLTQKKKKYEGMTVQERFNKAGSMLARRGFDLDSIKAAIDSVFGKMV